MAGHSTQDSHGFCSDSFLDVVTNMVGILIVLAVEVTLLPAQLSLVGRAAFWPSRAGPHWSQPGAWGKVAARVSGRPVRALLAGVLAFGALSLVVLAYAPSEFAPESMCRQLGW